MTAILPDPSSRPPLEVTTPFVPDDGALASFADEMTRCLGGDRRIIASLPRHLYRAFARFSALRLYVWSKGVPVYTANPRFHSMIRTSLDATKAASESVHPDQVASLDYCWAMRPYDNMKKRIAVASYPDVMSGSAAGIVGHRNAWSMIGPSDRVIMSSMAGLPEAMAASFRAVSENTHNARCGPYVHVRVLRPQVGRQPRAYLCERAVPIVEGKRVLEAVAGELAAEVFAEMPEWVVGADAAERLTQSASFLAGRMHTQKLTVEADMTELIAWGVAGRWLPSDDAAQIKPKLARIVKHAAKSVEGAPKRDNLSWKVCAAIAGLVVLDARAGELEDGLRGASRNLWQSAATRAITSQDAASAAQLLAALADVECAPGGTLSTCVSLATVLLETQEHDATRLDTYGAWGCRDTSDPLHVLLLVCAAIRGLSFIRPHVERAGDLNPDHIDRAVALATRVAFQIGLDLVSRGFSVHVDDPFAVHLLILAEAMAIGDGGLRRPPTPLVREALEAASFSSVRFDFDYPKYEILDRVDRLELPPPEPSRVKPADHFRLLASNVDVAPMLAELEAREAYWHLDTSRQKNTNEQRHTETIYLRGGRKRVGMPVEDVHGVRYTKSTIAFPSITSWVQRFADGLEADVGRMLVARLKGNQQVFPHYDSGQYVCFWTRFHLVLKTQGSIMRSADEEYLFEAGDLFWFDNEAVHVAFNKGDDWRIHVIFDLKPRSLTLPPDAEDFIPERRGIDMPAPAIPL